MRYRLLVGVIATCVACGKEPAPRSAGSAAGSSSGGSSVAPKGGTAAPSGDLVRVEDAGPSGPHDDLATALLSVIPADARVIGIGELHNRTDRAGVRSALAAFTATMPRLGERMSDLIVETWIVDPKCGQKAVQATQQIETDVKRPESTKSEIALLADAARAAKVQPHAMTVQCDDYKRLIKQGQLDPAEMLTLTTRELTRIATSAVAHRDKQPDRRPWIVIYGGALHNDRSPAPGVEEWSYAPALDRVTGDHYVEVDLIVPELAAADPTSQKQPWYPLVERAADRVQVFERSPRSFVLVLPRAR